MRWKQIRQICCACGTLSWGCSYGVESLLVLLLVVVSVMIMLGNNRSPGLPKSVAINNSSSNSTFTAAVSSSHIHRKRGREDRIHDADICRC